MNHALHAMMRASDEKAQNRSATIRRLLGELTVYWHRLLGIGGLVIIGAVAQATAPWLISRAIDKDIANRDSHGLAITMLFLLAAYTVGQITSYGQVLLVGDVGQRFLAQIRQRLFDWFQVLPLSFFDRRPVGDLMSRVTNDVDTLNQLVSQGLTQLLGSLFTLVGIVIAMLILDWRLALVSFTIIPLMLVTTSAFAKRARQASLKARETTGDVTADLQEEIVGVRQAQAFNRTATNIERFRQRNAANRDANVQAVGITSAFAPAIQILSSLATALVIGFGGYLVFDARLTVGLLAAFLIYVQQFFRPIQLVSQVYTQAQSALAGSERIYGILDEPREPVDPPGTPALGRIEGMIDFDDVTFGYDPARPVLHDISFHIEPGQTVALVGQTGAGKTTIANLIPRFYDIQEGAILLDGQNIEDVTRDSVRAQMGIVLQEPYLFSGTVRENIAYGRPDATLEQVQAAAKAVEAHEFIEALPKGYDTPLGEAGAQLSQGQRQLLSFARAVLADPRILILDEATSRIDTRTEAIIQRALQQVLAGRTSVVIAHRLSTIRDADLILVIDQGRIVERGTHEALLAQEGVYADLYRRQFRDPAPKAATTSKEAEAAPVP